MQSSSTLLSECLTLGEKPSGYRWIIVSLLFLATTINYLDRQVMSLLKPVLEKTFHWSESDYASLVTAFTFAYGSSTLFVGYVIDRISTKRGYTTSIFVSSLAAMAHALAGSTFGFMVARALLEIGEGRQLFSVDSNRSGVVPKERTRVCYRNL